MNMSKVYVNQWGYLPNSPKTAVIAGNGSDQPVKIRVINEQDSCVLEQEAVFFGYGGNRAEHVPGRNIGG